jgi:phage head maturation protease
MSDTPNQNFKIVAAITGYTLRKSADGTDKYVLSGMASNANIDLTGERMADTALTAMAKSLEVNAVTINNEHGSGWDDDFGEVTKLWVTDTHELMMEAELDPDHYRTKTLIKALDKGKKLGLSIGGVVKEAAMEFFEDIGRKVMTYKDIALFHVAITGTPAVADTWVTPITKSVKDWKETPMPNEDIKKSEEQVEEVVEETPTETPETPVVEEAPASAEGDEPEDIDQDTSEKSEAAEESDAEVTPDPETPPATPEAPDQKDEAPASDEPPLLQPKETPVR